MAGMKTSLLACLLTAVALAACGVDSTPQSSGASSSASSAPAPASDKTDEKKAQ